MELFESADRAYDDFDKTLEIKERAKKKKKLLLKKTGAYDDGVHEARNVTGTAETNN